MPYYITSEGNAKLVDFGCCKKAGRRRTSLGTAKPTARAYSQHSETETEHIYSTAKPKPPAQQRQEGGRRRTSFGARNQQSATHEQAMRTSTLVGPKLNFTNSNFANSNSGRYNTCLLLKAFTV